MFIVRITSFYLLLTYIKVVLLKCIHIFELSFICLDTMVRVSAIRERYTQKVETASPAMLTYSNVRT